MCSAPVAPLPLGLSAAAAELGDLQPQAMCPQLQQLPFSSIMYGVSNISRNSSFIDLGELDTGCSLGAQDQFLFPEDVPASQVATGQDCCLLDMLEPQVNAPRQLQRQSLDSGSCDSIFQPGSSSCYGETAGEDSSCEDDARCFEQALHQLSQLGCGGDFNPSDTPSQPASSNGQQALTTFTWDSAMTNAFVPRAPFLPAGPDFDMASSSRSLSPALPFELDMSPSMLIPLDAPNSTIPSVSYPSALPSCLLQPDIKPLLKRASRLLQPFAAAQTTSTCLVDSLLPHHCKPNAGHVIMQASSDYSEEAILSSSSDLWHQPLLPILSDASNTTLVSLAALDDDSLTTQHLTSFHSASSSALQSAVEAAEAAASGSEEGAALTKPSSHQHKNGGPCDHCGTAESPQWRRGPSNKPTLCNACGTRFRRTNQLGPAGLNAGNRTGSAGTARMTVQPAADARGRKETASAAAAAARELAAITPIPAPKEKEVLPAKRIPKRSGHLVADEDISNIQEERSSKRQRVPPRHK